MLVLERLIHVGAQHLCTPRPAGPREWDSTESLLHGKRLACSRVRFRLARLDAGLGDRATTARAVDPDPEQRNSDEVRVEWRGVLVDRVALATRGIGLPKLNCCARYRCSVDSQYAAGEFNDLARRSPRPVRDASEIEIMRGLKVYGVVGSKCLLRRRTERFCRSNGHHERASETDEGIPARDRHGTSGNSCGMVEGIHGATWMLHAPSDPVKDQRTAEGSGSPNGGFPEN